VDGHRFVIRNRNNGYEADFSGVDAEADISPNVIPTATFTLDDDDDLLPKVLEPGASCAVYIRGVERFRGEMNAYDGDGPDGSITITVTGDLQMLWAWNGWQSPTRAADAQNTEYRTYTGPSETVFKNALAENIARLGVPWTVAPSQGRGSTVRVQFRMHPLADKLIPILDADNLMVVLTYAEDGSVLVDVREPVTVPGVLTVESGVPDEFTFSGTGATASRAVVGGRGEGTAREFVEVIYPARETTWRQIKESFVDARNTEVGSDITIDGHQELAERAGRVGIATPLVETDRFTYGTDFQEGDLVAVRVGPVQTLQRISISTDESAEDGFVLTARVGEIDVSADEDAVLARQVASLARDARDRGRR
jgi:hypothetical protein